MATKRELREQKKAERYAKFEATKKAQIRKVLVGNTPVIAVSIMAHGALPVIAPSIISLEVLATPRASFDGSRFSTTMTWCVRKKDTEGKWPWGELRAWRDDEWDDDINPTMSDLARLTWGEIDKFSSGGHKTHHHQELADVSEHAQKRWIMLGLEQFDVLFRFRLGNTKRAWGFEAQGHFFMVWWERHHRIYPVGA